MHKEDGMFSWSDAWFRWSVLSLVVLTLVSLLLGSCGCPPSTPTSRRKGSGPPLPRGRRSHDLERSPKREGAFDLHRRGARKIDGDAFED